MSPKRVSRAKFLENVELQKRLLTYSTVASLATAAGLASTPGVALAAPVVSLDPEPDVVVSNPGTYDIDFDQDTNPEFILRATSFGGNDAIQVQFFNSGGDEGRSVIGYPQGAFTYAKALDFQESVSGGRADWYLFTKATLGYTAAGAWPGVGTKYLGLRFYLDGNTSDYYYGWVQLSVASDSSTVTIERYGYNTTQGGSIPAAVTMAAVETSSGGAWLQAVAAGSFAVLGGVLAWLRQRVGRWLKRGTA